ncbi:hypothetical protein [Paludisphaera sp.]|uniref:hypothetical protein n=1 Tax=Paludisphaera sp. TaxID=2017432 RepID=UPI00301BD486
MSLPLKRIATVGCLLLAGLLSGCGGDTAPQGPVAEDRPDAGLEASKSIMQMQPPGPGGKKAKN